MEKTINELNAALKLVSMISVSGDAVDIIALAKQNIRQAIDELSKESEEK